MRGFFEKYEPRIERGAPSGCWLWSAGTVPDGYGSLSVGGKVHLAHRLAFECENGAGSAAGQFVRHQCDTPACVNPAHLLLGTHVDNMADMAARGRSCLGGRNVNAKLTEAAVREIRTRYRSRDKVNGAAALGREFGLDKSSVAEVVRRETWRHVA